MFRTRKAHVEQGSSLLLTRLESCRHLSDLGQSASRPHLDTCDFIDCWKWFHLHHFPHFDTRTLSSARLLHILSLYAEFSDPQDFCNPSARPHDFSDPSARTHDFSDPSARTHDFSDPSACTHEFFNPSACTHELFQSISLYA